MKGKVCPRSLLGHICSHILLFYTNKNAMGIFILLYLVSCKPCNNGPNAWKIALRTTKTGKVVKGSKQELITAIRNGAEIKIGWGNQGKQHSIEHLSEPIWLAVLDQSEVIAYLHPQSLGHVDWDQLESSYSNVHNLHEEWRVALTTNGSFDAIWYDRRGDSLLKRVPQKHAMTWFVKYNGEIANGKLFDD